MKRLLCLLLALVPLCAWAQLGPPPADCVDAIKICDAYTVIGNPSREGNVIDIDANSIVPNAGCLEEGENNSFWFYFEIDEGAPDFLRLGFTITPNGGNGQNYDFAVYGPDARCGVLPPPIRCSFASETCAFCPSTGLGMGATDETEDDTGDGFVLELPAFPGSGWFVLVNNQTRDAGQGFSLQFTNDGADWITCNPCRIDSIDVPEVVFRCPTDRFTTLETEAINGFGYPWTFDWQAIGDGDQYITNPAARDVQLELPSGFTDTLIYEVTVTSDDEMCVASDTIMLISHPVPDLRIEGPDTICTDGGVIQYQGFPEDGDWRGIVSRAGNVDPADLSLGANVIVYRFIDEFGCRYDISNDVWLSEPTPASIEPVEPLCFFDDPIMVTASPPGGTWLFPVVDGILDPARLGQGNNVISYVFINDMGCISIATTTVELRRPVPSQIVGDEALCSDDSVYTYEGFLEDGIWGGVADTLGQVFPVDLGAGEYTIEYTSPPFDCTESAEIEIVVNDPPVASIEDTIYVCNTGPTGLDFETFILGGDSSGTWRDVDSSGASGAFPLLDFSGVAADTLLFQYTTATALAGCDELILDLIVIVEDCPCPELIVSPLDSVCQVDVLINLQDQVIAGDSGVWTIVSQPTPGMGTIIDDSLLISPLLPSGIYRLRYTVPDTLPECPDSIELDLYLSDAAIIDLADTIPVCNSDSSGALSHFLDLYDAVLSDDQSGTWQDLDGPATTGSVDSLLFTDVTPGTYRYRYTSSGQESPCGANDAILVVQVIDCSCPVLLISAIEDQCSDEITIDLDDYLQSDLLGTWSLDGAPTGADPATLSGSSLTGMGSDAGTYVVTYTLSTPPPDGCPEQVSAQIEVIEQADLVLRDTVGVCNTGASGTLPSTINLFDQITVGSVDGTWRDLDASGAAGDSTLLDWTDIDPGIYAWSYTTPDDREPCAPLTDTLYVRVVDCTCPPVGLVSQMSICNSEESLLLDELIILVAPGTWSIASSPTGTAPAVLSGAELIVEDADAGEYLLVYTLDGTVPSGCPTADSVRIFLGESPQASVTGEITICNSTATGEVTMTNLSDLIISGDRTGVWTDVSSSGASGVLPMQDFAAVPAGAYTYRYTLTGTDGCTDERYDVTVNVVDCECPVLSLAAPRDYCLSEASVGLSVLQLDDTEGTWSISPTGSITISSAGLMDLSSGVEGDYTLIFTLSGDVPATCPDRESFTIRVSDDPIAGSYLGDTTVCIASTTNIALADRLAGADADGAWSFIDGPMDASGELQSATGLLAIDNLISGTYNFLYTLNPVGACDGAAQSVAVFIAPLPVADAGPDQEITDCDERDILLGTAAVPGWNYEWRRSGMVVGTEGQITVSEGGLYSLRVTSGDGCVSTDEVSITADAAIISALVLDVMPPQCQGDQNALIAVDDIIGGLGPFSYTLNGQSVGSTIANLGAGEYVLVVSDVGGCSVTREIIIRDPDLLDISLPDELEVNRGEELLINYDLLSGLASILEWSDQDSILCIACEQLFYSPFVSGYVTLVAMDSSGCTDIERVLVQVNVPRRIYIPNVFSPNDDGTNDTWRIFGADELLGIKSLQVYDRWGTMVYQAQDVYPVGSIAGWDGRISGEEAPAGVYSYQLRADYRDGVRIIYTGDLTLIK